MDQITQQLQNINVDPPSTGWFDLPAEMREMVIDRMDPKTRCRFAQCSKICEEEAKKSKNYLEELIITQAPNGTLLLLLIHNSARLGFHLEFKHISHAYTLVECFSIRQVQWREIEAGNSKSVRMKYLKKYIETYKRSIQSVCLDDETVSLSDFSVRQLRSLNFLRVKSAPSDCQNLVDCGFVDLEQISRIDTLDIEGNIHLTFDQIANIKGECIQMSSIKVDQINLNGYLKMLQNGEIRGNIMNIYLSLQEPFDVSSLIHGLNIFNVNDMKEASIFVFSFKSEARENGMYAVCYTVNEIRIMWKTNT